MSSVIYEILVKARLERESSKVRDMVVRRVNVG